MLPLAAEFKVDADTHVKMQAGGKITLTAETEITLVVGRSMVKLTKSGIEIAGPAVTVNSLSGDTTVTAQRGVVHLKP